MNDLPTAMKKKKKAPCHWEFVIWKIKEPLKMPCGTKTFGTKAYKERTERKYEPACQQQDVNRRSNGNASNSKVN